MKQVYQANDKSIHETAMAALERDEFIDEINDLVRSVRPDEMDTCDFANGRTGPIQLTSEQVDGFKAGYLALVDKRGSDKERELARQDPGGFIGRYFCDSGSPLYRLYGIWSCIDKRNRLWGQPYLKNKADGTL